MSASADTPPTDIQHNEGPQYQVLGTGDGNEGRFAQGLVLIDPATGAPYAATAGNASDTVAVHDTLLPSQGLVVTAGGSAQTTIPDGDDHALGATTDAATANTVIGRLKKLISLAPSALTGSGNLRVAVQEALPAGTNSVGGVSVADGADVAQGTSTDAAGAATVLGQLKGLAADLAGTLSVREPKGDTAFTSVTVDTTPTLVLAANPERISALIQNVVGGSALVLGNDANVVASSPGEGQYLGLVIAPGGDAEDTDSASAWYGVCQSGSADVRIAEVS